MIRYVSLFSGVGSASFALGRIRRGFRPLAFAESCPAASAVLAAHFPGVPNLGDVANALTARLGAVDLLVGGPPCQPYSVAGSREGLHSADGRLSLLFWEAFWALRCKVGIMENVPGMLSETFDGRDSFGSILGTAIGHHGFAVPKPDGGWPRAGRIRGPLAVAAWRTADAKGFGGSQARNRLFVSVARNSIVDPCRCLAIGEADGHDPAAGQQGGYPPAALARRGPHIPFEGWNGDETPKVMTDTIPTLRASQGGGGTGIAYRDHYGRAVIRRLTLTEREEASGLPPGWTAVPGVSDAARIKLTGNTMFAPLIAMFGILLADAVGENQSLKRSRGRPRYHSEEKASTGAERKAIYRASAMAK